MSGSFVEGRCNLFVSWWDGEYEAYCELPKGHDGDHWDGVSWSDDEGNKRDHAHPGADGT